MTTPHADYDFFVRPTSRFAGRSENGATCHIIDDATGEERILPIGRYNACVGYRSRGLARPPTSTERRAEREHAAAAIVTEVLHASTGQRAWRARGQATYAISYPRLKSCLNGRHETKALARAYIEEHYAAGWTGEPIVQIIEMRCGEGRVIQEWYPGRGWSELVEATL